MGQLLATIERMYAEVDAATGELDREYLMAVEPDGATLAGYLLPYLLLFFWACGALVKHLATRSIQPLAARAGWTQRAVPWDEASRARLTFARWLYEHERLIG